MFDTMPVPTRPPVDLIAALRSMAKDDDVSIRHAAVRALARHPTPGLISTLRAIVPALPSESRIEICTQALQDPADTVAGTAAALMLETDDASCGFSRHAPAASRPDSRAAARTRLGTMSPNPSLFY